MDSGIPDEEIENFKVFTTCADTATAVKFLKVSNSAMGAQPPPPRCPANDLGLTFDRALAAARRELLVNSLTTRTNTM